MQKLQNRLDKLSAPKDQIEEAPKRAIKYSIASFFIYLFGMQLISRLQAQLPNIDGSKGVVFIFSLASAIAVVGGINIVGLIKNIKEDKLKIVSIVVLILHILFLLSIFTFLTGKGGVVHG